jgi:hypothetical protein
MIKKDFLLVGRVSRLSRKPSAVDLDNSSKNILEIKFRAAIRILTKDLLMRMSKELLSSRRDLEWIKGGSHIWMTMMMD